MAWTKINTHGVTKLPGKYQCESTDEKPSEGIVEGSELLEWDTSKRFVFAEGEWREITTIVTLSE